ncbi:MAG: glutamate-1-semialdehyde 2,1-aminomutase [Candidatus Omnitrophica bacterium]|nr:glutamate-1-semialdehyde 2,1-aminomutase [Candidatus Omnitrophota bacterium]
MIFKQSARWRGRGVRSLVGAVNSPVRSFAAVESPMLFAAKAGGPYLWDADGNKYIDYIMSWGVGILGHAYPPVVAAAVRAMKHGASFGLATAGEIRLAEKLKRHIKSLDKVRFVTSGTEACMTAVRLSRAFTGKTKILKFDGAYHGHFDSLLVKSGSGNLTLGLPSGKGILPAYTRDTLSLPFNDIGMLKAAIARNRGEIAAVIVEPVACNAGVILPQGDFLKYLRRMTKEAGMVLIFDEVITGFRLGLGGAQKVFGAEPDLTCLGKIIGGGFPVGAVGGRREIMDLLAPVGPVYQAGTLAGNPVAIAAGLQTLECLEASASLYKDLETKTFRLAAGIRQAAAAAGVALKVNTIGSLFSLFFTDQPVTSYAAALTTDKARYARWFSGLCRAGILFPPSAFEACFVSAGHTDAVIEKTVKGLTRVLESGI